MGIFSKLKSKKHKDHEIESGHVVCPDSIQRNLDNYSPDQIRMMIRAYKGEIKDDTRY